MDEDHNLRDEFNRQFELRTGLTNRDKAKYWNTNESQQQWEELAAQERNRPRTLILAVGAVAVIVAVAIVWSIAASSKTQLSQNQPESGTEGRFQSAEEVARAFLEKTEPQSRLDLAREPEIVAKHLSSYSGEALSHTPAQLERRGHHVENGLARTAFAVRFDSGGYRMLNVVETADGLRVDWDSLCALLLGELG
jgi:hypothetical protein